jgi:hypothetical protein
MLLDTSGLLCLHFSTEPLHTQACVEYQKATVRLTKSYNLEVFSSGIQNVFYGDFGRHLSQLRAKVRRNAA